MRSVVRKLAFGWRRWLLAGAFLTAVGAAVYYIGYPYYQARSELELARHALDELDPDEAKVRLEAVLVKWPAPAESTFLLARACRLTGDFPGARRRLLEAEARGWPRQELDFELLLLEAQIAGKLTPGNALGQYVLRHTTEEPMVLEALVAGGMRANLIDRTMITLMHWIQHYPQDWRPRFLRGLHLLGLGLVEAAQLDFEQALALHPDHKESHLRLGQALQRIGFDHTQAIVHLERFLHELTDVGRRAYPRNEADALSSLARSQWALNQPEAARGTLERLLEGYPNCVAGLLTLAQLELDGDRPAEALSAIRRAEAAGPTDMQELRAIAGFKAQVFRALGNSEESAAVEATLKRLTVDETALNETLKELRKDSSDSEKHRQVGLIYLRWGLGEEALRWFDPLLRANPGDPVIHQALAEFYEKRPDAQSQQLAAKHRLRAEQSNKTNQGHGGSVTR